MMHNVRRARLSVTALAIAAVAVWAGPAEAGTPIQLGQVATGNPDTCVTATSWVQRTVAGAPSYTVPSAGTITSWSHRALNVTPTSGRLQVWRPAGDTNYTLVGRSDVKAFTASMLNNFPINLPVQAGDVLGFRNVSFAFPGCMIPTADPGDTITTALGTDPTPGATVTFSAMPIGPFRLNVSATFDPADPAPPPSPTSLDSSATKGKQSADKLKIKLTADQNGTLDVGGKGKIAQRAPASSSAKSKKYALKKKTGIALQAGVKKVIRLKFKKNRKTLKRIEKLQKRSKKARRRSNVIVNLTANTAAGLVTTSKVKIKLKP